MSKFLGWLFDAVMRGPISRFTEDLNRPFAVQESALRRILLQNAKTDFGIRHEFSSIAERQGQDIWTFFKRCVPIRRYEDFLPDIDRMKNGEKNILVPDRPEMFSLTSGTTSEPKFCPVNRAFIKEHHRQHLLWMYNVYRDHPAANSGKYLVMASPAEMGRTAGGIPYGAMSGKQLDVQSIPVRRRQAVPAKVQHLDSAEKRWFNTILFALMHEDLRIVTSVNPSTLVAFANRLARDAEMYLDCLEKGHPARGAVGASPLEKRLADSFVPDPGRAKKLREALRCNGSLSPATAWPELAVILTWQGGASSFYLPHVAALWGNIPQRCLGLRASEGTFSIPLHDHTPSGTLAIGGHAMEFLPAEAGDPKPNSPTLQAGELEEGGLYRLIATTSGGFCRYDMGDLIRVTGFNRKTPEIAFERRAGSVLSATGEKVTEDQALGAMESAAAPGPLLNGFSITWEIDEDITRYVLALECAGGSEIVKHRSGLLLERLRQLQTVWDFEMMNRNCEYHSKREDGRLATPRIIILKEDSYEKYRLSRTASGKPENQIKNPILIPPPGPGRVPVAGMDLITGANILMEL